jgi:hypothetical protein
MRGRSMRKRARQEKPEIIGEIILKILEQRNIPHTSADRHLVDIWRRAVGPQIAAQTYPHTLKRGSLYVRVSAPVWLHQLQFMKEEILDKIRELSSREVIRTLFFTIGEIPSPAQGGIRALSSNQSLVPLSERDRNMIEESLSTVPDPELREILNRVMMKEISRRREREKSKVPGR